MAIQGNTVQTPDPEAQRFMAVPIVPRKRVLGDGTEPTGPSKAQAPGEQQDGSQPAPSGPTLATVDVVTQFRTVEALVRSQDRVARNRWAIDTHFRRLDANIPFSRLEKIPNQSIWVAKLPPGVSHEQTAAVPNKAQDLCNKVVDALLADPPKPAPQAIDTDNEAAAEAAELVAEWLRQVSGESGCNLVQHYRWALRNALTACSGFLHFDVDEQGGGYQPLQVLAHPQATDPKNPLVAPVIDPTTGQPQVGPDGQPVLMPTPNPVLRYVSAGNQFVQTAAEADKVWLPAIRVKRLKREQVRTYPITASVEEADALIVLDWCTLAEAVREWPETVGQMTAEQLANLAVWRHAFSEMIVPMTFRGGLADGMTGPAKSDVGSLSPLLQRRMFFYRVYVRKTPEYPEGLYLAISGANGGTELGQESLEYTVQVPGEGPVTRCRDIPVIQVTPQQDIEGMDPMGYSFESRFAGSTEATATLLAAYLDAIDQRLHPHVFIRSTITMDEDDWADRTTPTVLNPMDQEPTYEQFPAMPDPLEVVQMLHTSSDVASGLTATAQGLDTSNSVSGVAKQLTVRQAQISLAGIQQQLLAAFARGWRIMAQLAQAKFTTPQLLKASGEDGSAEVRWWTGEDFAGIDDIGIEPGSGTMMTPEAKANYVAFLQQQQWMTADEAAGVAVSGIVRDLGLPPDKAKQAIERSVGVWLEYAPQGPDGWAQQFQAYQQDQQRIQMQGQAMQQQWQQAASVAQQTGQPVPPQPPMPPPQVPAPWSPFLPKPNDVEPKVAAATAKRLSALMLSPQYANATPEWRSLVDQTYQRAMQALQPAPQPQLPRGVTVQMKGDAQTVAQEEQAAMQPFSNSPPPAPSAPPAAPQPLPQAA